jgi:hypothetical protein
MSSRKEIWVSILDDTHDIMFDLKHLGKMYRMSPGQWYGPSIISKVMRDLSVYHNNHLGGHMNGKITMY